MNFLTLTYTTVIALVLLGRVTAWSTLATALAYSLMVLYKGAKRIHQRLWKDNQGHYFSGEIKGLVFGYKPIVVKELKPCTKNSLDWDIWYD